MIVQVHVMLKDGVLDPQGLAIAHALRALGFDGVNGARQGKVIALEVAEATPQARIAEMCEALLANTVIETYRIEMPG